MPEKVRVRHRNREACGEVKANIQKTKHGTKKAELEIR